MYKKNYIQMEIIFLLKIEKNPKQNQSSVMWTLKL